MSAFDKSGNENAGAGVEARPPRLNLPCDDMCGSEKAAVRQVDNSNAKLAVGAASTLAIYLLETHEIKK